MKRTHSYGIRTSFKLCAMCLTPVKLEALLANIKEACYIGYIISLLYNETQNLYKKHIKVIYKKKWKSSS